MHYHTRDFIQLSLYHGAFSYDIKAECGTILCWLSMTPGMIIPMIAGPQGTRPEDYAVHLSPRAKLPRTIYVLLSSLCL